MCDDSNDKVIDFSKKSNIADGNQQKSFVKEFQYVKLTKDDNGNTFKEEAKQKVIAAQAEAKSMAIRAQALTQNKSLVEYEAVQKWDGKMPQYMLGNSVPFINVNAK